MFQFVRQHPYTVLSAISSVAAWLFNNVATRIISALPAPTKESTKRYVFWFQFLNKLVGNSARAKSTAIEDSPNWPDALEKHLASLQNPANPPQEK
jgi:hypothetical protein